MKSLNAFLTLTLLASTTAHASGFRSLNLVHEQNTEKALRMAHNRMYQLKEKGNLVGNSAAFEPEIVALKNMLELKFGDGIYEQYVAGIRERRQQFPKYLNSTFKSKPLAEGANNAYEEALRTRKNLIGKFNSRTATAAELERRWVYHGKIEAQQKHSKKSFLINFFPELEFSDDNIDYLRFLYRKAASDKKEFRKTLSRPVHAASAPVNLVDDEEKKPTKDFSSVPVYIKEQRTRFEDRSHSQKVLETVDKNQADRIQLTAAATKITDARIKKHLWIEALEIEKEGRFTAEEQKQIRKLLKLFIPAFEYEQRVSHAPREHIIISCQNKSSSEIQKQMQKVIDGNALLKSIVEKKEQEDERTNLKETDQQTTKPRLTFAYDSDRFVHLENMAMFKNLTAEVQKHGLSQNFLKSIHLQDGSSSQKTFPTETLKARDELAELLDRQSGFVVLPHRKKEKRHSVVFKVTSNTSDQYLYFDSSLLANDIEQYNTLKGNHTFVFVEGHIFAIPHEGPHERVKSLTIKSALSSQQNSEIYDMAQAVWANHQNGGVSDPLKLGLPFKLRETLSGWAAPITLDVQTGKVSLSGWAGIEDVGAANYISVYYKTEHLGRIRVNLQSPDVQAHFKAISESKNKPLTGDYNQARFQGDVTLRSEDARSFKSENLFVIGLSEKYEYNFLTTTPVIQKGYTFNMTSELTNDGGVLSKREGLEGWAAPITLKASEKELTLSGWSAIQREGAASKIGVFYKGLNLGFLPVDLGSPDVAQHYKTLGVPGTYTSVRFSGTLNLSHLNLQNFDQNELTVVGFDSQNQYNFLNVACFEIK